MKIACDDGDNDENSEDEDIEESKTQ